MTPAKAFAIKLREIMGGDGNVCSAGYAGAMWERAKVASREWGGYMRINLGRGIAYSAEIGPEKACLKIEGDHATIERVARVVRDLAATGSSRERYIVELLARMSIPEKFVDDGTADLDDETLCSDATALYEVIGMARNALR